ncbi:MAG: Zn-ribbon containing protein [Candidatus Nanohaloarchaea archaeon]|nr:Zn-ribbon containing protein [Candidatus Nanohaloarchaea archaeon]
MPHKCMNCGEEYEEGDDALIEGCEECGSTLFLYEQEGEEYDTEELEEEKKSVMEELDKFIRDVKSKVQPSDELQFDLQSITVMEDGVYEIDVGKLIEEIPLIVEIKDGSYKLHLASVFSHGRDKGLRLQDLDIDEDVKERIRENAGDGKN